MKRKHTDILVIVIIGVLFVASVYIFPLIKEWMYTVSHNTNLLQVSDYGFDLRKLTLEHIEMSVIAVIGTILIGLPLGVFATTKIGKQFEPLIVKLTSISKALPAIGVLAVLIPLLGYGIKSAAVALLFCGVMPIIFNTISGLENVPDYLVEVGEAMGMKNSQVFFKIKLPLSFPVLMAGIRASSIIVIGCATLAAMAGAGGLGTLVYAAGVRGFDPIMLLQGALPICLFALFVDRLLGYLENRLKEKYAVINPSDV